ncbi:unnamed protein product [Prorocentrum cordatum]|uniref:Uncharacterized protein n=1 Tax=Prorocentrum cordatum TaxID=2364126 RepID=A0ABN9TL63_9DINO|nr:unnamed protein product [Polarella glacialis]
MRRAPSRAHRSPESAPAAACSADGADAAAPPKAPPPPPVSRMTFDFPCRDRRASGSAASTAQLEVQKRGHTSARAQSCFSEIERACPGGLVHVSGLRHLGPPRGAQRALGAMAASWSGILTLAVLLSAGPAAWGVAALVRSRRGLGEKRSDQRPDGGEGARLAAAMKSQRLLRVPLAQGAPRASLGPLGSSGPRERSSGPAS